MPKKPKDKRLTRGVAVNVHYKLHKALHDRCLDARITIEEFVNAVLGSELGVNPETGEPIRRAK
jgi:hypothetical protein